jgi:hypothetical protein
VKSVAGANKFLGLFGLMTTDPSDRTPIIFGSGWRNTPPSSVNRSLLLNLWRSLYRLLDAISTSAFEL